MFSSIEKILTEIVIAVIIGVLMFFGWLFKRSVFGRIDSMSKDIRDIKENYQTKDGCLATRHACQALVLQSISSLGDKVDTLKDDLCAGQKAIISRVDKHLEAHIEKRLDN